jgi:hypothetical protein
LTACFAAACFGGGRLIPKVISRRRALSHPVAAYSQLTTAAVAASTRLAHGAVLRKVSRQPAPISPKSRLWAVISNPADAAWAVVASPTPASSAM